MRRARAALLSPLFAAAGAAAAGPVTDCYGFPAQPFSATNKAAHAFGVPQGAQAVDFTLLGVDGAAHTLSKMLAQKPVFIMQGAWT